MTLPSDDFRPGNQIDQRQVAERNMGSSKLVTVFGATGMQGGGVIDALLREGGYSIRAVTRNVNGEKAKQLASRQGVEVVRADMEDIGSLKEAIKGAYAVFGMTNFVEYVADHGPVEASHIELRHGQNLANACAASTSLQHYIWTTLPSSTKTTEGEIFVPHFEGKAKTDEYILESLPGLAKKTSFLYVGFYALNFVAYPFLKPAFLAPAGKYIFLRPVQSSSKVPIAGDLSVNIGLFVTAILANPALTRGKYSSVQTEILSQQQILDYWSNATGKDAVYIVCTQEEFNKLYPVWGDIMAAQFKWNEKHGGNYRAWAGDDFFTAEQLGIADRLVGWDDALKGLKDQLLA
ncbi:hypothetical protein CLAIMM_03886 [Cladophialophora immunda]|nr:hypothetical protein CLAIMM_03886 [Cladophialophora immunda]